MSTVSSIAEHIVITPGTCGGKPRIAGHRITVQDIVIWHEHQRMSPPEIVAMYEGITLADVHAALAYYFDHPTEIEETIKRDACFASEIEASQPSLVEKAWERIRELKAASDPR
jgi:uncharacterized protein (DUF433 family)